MKIFNLKTHYAQAFDENLWFFVILTALLFTAGGTVSQPPVRLLLFWALLVVHMGWHWFSTTITPDTRAETSYLVGQTGLVLILVYLSSSPIITLTTFTGLMAVCIGLFGLTFKIKLVIMVHIGLMILCFLGLGGLTLLGTWLQPMSLNLILVLVFMGLYRRQIEAKDHAEQVLKQLEHANQQLATYAKEVENITVAMERGRMARELHDTLAQGLAGLILQMEAMADHLKHGRLERAEGIVRQAMSRARATLAETRQAIDDLRSDSMNGLFSQRLHAKIASLLVATELTPHLDIVIPPTINISHETADHTLHIVGELLHNVIRHAYASAVWINVVTDTHQLHLLVRDNGTGFSPLDMPTKGHYGLQGVRERVILAGGDVTIESLPKNGTSIRVRLPLIGETGS